MWEIAALCVIAVIMTFMYCGTAHPVAYAFMNTLAGSAGLIASEMMFGGNIEGITPYNAALSVILGVPGVIAHRLIEMM